MTASARVASARKYPDSLSTGTPTAAAMAPLMTMPMIIEAGAGHPSTVAP